MMILLLAVMTMFAESAAPDSNDDAHRIRVATFNVRYGAAKDGENAWEKRRTLFFDTIKTMNPDVMGVQEALAFQMDEMKAAMPEHEYVGTGRNDGKREGEFSAVFFRTKRFEKLENGQFWLSDKPETVGSKGWDADLPRIVTWIRLRDRNSGDVMLFVNTHFDHKGVRARAESAKLLRGRIDQLRKYAPVILVGDFNATQDQDPYKTLRGNESDASHLLDSFRLAHPDPGREDGTAHRFTGERNGPRIDWILHTREFRTVACEIVHQSDRGRYPSDHFPVIAVLERPTR